MTVTIRERPNLNPRTIESRDAMLETNKRLSTVDVVIPCYNYGRYLCTCVGSVLSQRDVSVRVLVIDDASSDESPEVGAKLAASDSRVEFRRHEINKGHIATYNEGLIDWAQADYVVLLSSDDILTPGSLARATQVMDADESIGMVYGRALHFVQESELPTINGAKWSYSQFAGDDWLEGRCRAGHNVITSPEVVVRGSVQRVVGGYRPELPHAGDLEMWLRIAAVSNIAYVRGIPQAFYRVHPQSMMRTRYRGSFVDLCQRKATFDLFFQHNGHLLPDAHRLYALANRALAREALWDACRAYDRNEVEESQANELIKFAMAAYARANSLSEYGALRRRQRLGAVFCNRTQIFAPSALLRKVRRWVLKQQWKRRGV